MKIAVTAQDKDLNAHIDLRFGRCAYFIIYDTKTKDFQAIQNQNMEARNGAGVQSGQMMIDLGVQKVITGQAGPNAERILNNAHIEIISSSAKTVLEAIQSLNT